MRLPFDELVAIRLQKMKRHEALNLAIALMRDNDLVDVEAARRLLIVMRNELEGGNHANINEANMPWV